MIIAILIVLALFHLFALIKDYPYIAFLSIGLLVGIVIASAFYVPTFLTIAGAIVGFIYSLVILFIA